jgi:hypothetical protein
MTLESAAIAALGTVTTALCFLFQLLWKRSQECEQWRKDKEPIIEEMAQQLGIHHGITRMVNACEVKNCPYAGKLSVETFSVQREPKNKHERPA